MSKRSAVCWTAAVAVVMGCGGGTAGSDGSGDADEEKVFAEHAIEEDCAVLTTADMAAALGVSAEEIEERYEGCFYGWSGGHVYLVGVTIHESVERARGDYATFTEDVSAEEIAEGKEQVEEELSAKEAEGELTATEAAAGRALTDAMPERDYSHQSLPGVGDEASTDGHGTVRIRYGNLTVWFIGKTAEGEDWIDPGLAAEIGRRIVANVESL